MARRPDTTGELASRVALGLALSAFAVLALVPLVSPIPPDQDPGGRIEIAGRVTLLEREGLEVAVVAAALVGVSAAPLAMRRTHLFKAVQRLAAGGMALGVVVSITTAGMFFIPAALVMLLAARRRRHDHPLLPPGS